MNSNVELSAREDYFISGRKSCFKRSNFRAECCLLYKLTISVTRTLIKCGKPSFYIRKQRDQLGRFWGTCPQHKTIEFEVRQILSSEIDKNLHAF